MSVDDKVTTGERVRLRAAAWNTMVDAAAAWRANQLGGGATDGLDLEAASATVCRIKNITGSLRPRRSVLAVSDSLRDATDPELRNTIEFTGSAPTAGDEGRWCVLREHAPANGTAEAVIAGVAHVDVNVVSSSHGFAELEPGRTDRLISGETGSAKIIWIGGTSGVQPAVVRLLGPVARVPKYEFAAHQTTTTLASPDAFSEFSMDLPAMRYLDYNLGKAWKKIDDYTIECQIAGTYRFFYWSMGFDESTENPWPDNSPPKRYTWALQVQPHWCRKVAGTYSWTLHQAGSSGETSLTPGIAHVMYRGFANEKRFTAQAFDLADVPATGRVRLLASGVGLVSAYCQIAGRIQISRLGDIPVLSPSGTDEQGYPWTGT